MKPFEKRLCARTLVTLWAILWVYFAFASTLAEDKGVWSVVVPTAMALVVFAGSAVVAWVQERFGGPLLIVVGTVMILAATLLMHHNSVTTKLFVVGTLALPPLAAGLLLWSLHRKPGPATGSRF
jgi:hypothetical protein